MILGTSLRVVKLLYNPPKRHSNDHF